MKDDITPARRAAAWAGTRLDRSQEDLLGTYVRWLEEEALPAGGLGRNELPRLWRRHVADSLTFAGCWHHPTPPTSVLDVGSGVGLPGIPLAVLWPQAEVVLLDRSEQRSHLARRAVRVLGVGGRVSVHTGEAARHQGHYRFLVSRAALDAAAIARLGARLVPDGTAAVALRHGGDPPDPPGEGELVAVPPGVLDSPAWLLRMTFDAA